MKTIIDRSECKPLSDNIEGKLVVIKPDFFKPEFKDAKYQIVFATGDLDVMQIKWEMQYL